MSFIHIDNVREVESFACKCKVNFYLAGEIILKQGGDNNKFYFINEGLAEVIHENRDFIFFDYKKVEEFISNVIDLEAIEKEARRLEKEELLRRAKDSKKQR